MNRRVIKNPVCATMTTLVKRTRHRQFFFCYLVFPNESFEIAVVRIKALAGGRIHFWRRPTVVLQLHRTAVATSGNVEQQDCLALQKTIRHGTQGGP